MRLFSVVLVWLSGLACGCVTGRSPVAMGLQPDYSAVNLARIAFVPAFAHPDPTRKVVVDTSALNADRVLELLESQTLTAFRDQPGVSGLSPSAFRKAAAGRPGLGTTLEELLKAGVKPSGESAADAACRDRSNYLEYYVRCLARNPKWQNALADSSAYLFNSDAFLFLVLNELEKTRQGDRYVVTAGVTAFLVDANGGRLIWGREAREELASDVGRKTFPEWEPLFVRMISEPFWMDFPGRVIQRTSR